MEQIRTYLIFIETVSHLREYDRLGDVFEISNFSVKSNMSKYNMHTMTQEGNDFSFTTISDEDTVIISSKIFKNNTGSVFLPKMNIAVVRYWGDVIHECDFSGVFFTEFSNESSRFNAKFDYMSMSDKNKELKKYSTMLLPYFRDKKIDQILK